MNLNDKEELNRQSRIDFIKQIKEEECLEKAIVLSKIKKAKTRFILGLCNGENVTRKKNDSPDIVRLINDPANPLCGYYIGIEHFLVDQISKQKSGKSFSVSSEYDSHIQKIYKQGRTFLDNGENISEEIKRELAQNTFGYAASVHETDYEDLLNAFQYTLKKHLSKVQEYKKEMKAISGDAPYKLVFLIEINCLAPRTFLNIGRRTIPNVSQLFPVTEDIVSILNSVDQQDVDYVVLYFHQPHKKDVADVVAVEVGNVVSSLRQQGIHVFRFCGDNLKIRFNIEDYIQKTDNGYDIKYNMALTASENYMKLFIPGLRIAYLARTKGEPFLCSRIIQGLMYAFGNKSSFVEKEPGNWFVRSEFPQQIVLQRFDEFCEKYPIDKDDSNQENNRNVL